MKTQWQRYRELELIPASVPQPKPNRFFALAPLGTAWRLLIDALAREHICYEHRTEYLERCWAMDIAELEAGEQANTWHQLLMLMD
jgi:hypothetical protein